MLKKIVCILMAALLVFAFCACKKQSDDKQDPSGSKTDTIRTEDQGQKPEQTQTSDPADDTGNYTAESDDKTPFDGADADAVLLTFTGIKEAQVTAAQLAGLPLYEYSESSADDTPVYRGPLVKDVLALIGADNATKLSISYEGVPMTHEFVISELELDTAIFAVIRDGKLMEDGSVFICTTDEGFNYLLSVSEPYTLK